MMLRLEAYQTTLGRWLPVTVPLVWMRSRIEKAEKQSGLSRRDSKNLSMLQVVKDIARDKYEIDGARVDGSSDTVVQLLVLRVLAFLHARDDANDDDTNQRPRPGNRSPTPNRLARAREATALAFVERVLRGSARTQSGGDIYDAIALVCANQHVTLCPVSHDVLPVALRVDDADSPDGRFHLHLTVHMQFKAMQTLASPSSSAATNATSPLHGPLRSGTSRRPRGRSSSPR
ncbi:Aste57867_18788 [Aphanomyces stellatus]|uniref:Aste57867_18788 protein n=1 Tax=Aphanomyces stellatus TaxID=120398 RepID=A0A485LB05_9STRA|nr:hypothetical protein As57867_018724 [Aphanomyces stellatus]VFT95522.1 Aste57867_18788 [Aphanomyces stellatus]